SALIRRSAAKSAGDLLAPYKRFVLHFSLQLWAFWFHVMFAVVSIIVIAAAIVPGSEAAVPSAAGAMQETWSATLRSFDASPRALNIVGISFTTAGAALLFMYGYPFKRLLRARDVFVIGPALEIAE